MPTTPLRAVRVPPQLWDAAQRRAQRQGESVSTVIRRALEHYVDGSFDPARPAGPAATTGPADQTRARSRSRRAGPTPDSEALIAIGMIMQRLGVDEATAARHLAAHPDAAAGEVSG